ncbi:MAG: hypothetical protein AAGL29_05850 [Bacteroidota bacterium]
MNGKIFTFCVLACIGFQTCAQSEPKNTKDTLVHLAQSDTDKLKTKLLAPNVNREVENRPSKKDSVAVAQTVDTLNVEAKMLLHLEALLNGEVDRFLSFYEDNYSDVRIQNDTLTDKVVLGRMMLEVLENEFFRKPEKPELLKCIQPERTKVVDFKTALSMGLPIQMDGFEMQEGDIGVVVFWNGNCFFQGNIARVFRMIHGDWKIVAGF